MSRIHNRIEVPESVFLTFQKELNQFITHRYVLTGGYGWEGEVFDWDLGRNGHRSDNIPTLRPPKETYTHNVVTVLSSVVCICTYTAKVKAVVIMPIQCWL